MGLKIIEYKDIKKRYKVVDYGLVTKGNIVGILEHDLNLYRHEGGKPVLVFEDKIIFEKEE